MPDKYDPLDSGEGPETQRDRMLRGKSEVLKILRQSAQYQAEMRSDVREIRRDVEQFGQVLDKMRDSCAVAAMPIETPPEAEPVPKTVAAQVALLVASQLPWAAMFAAGCFGAILVYARIRGLL